jgi:hypothetical protein
MRELKYYCPGITLITIAVIIGAFPEILIAMIAATILFSGALALYIGHKMKKGFDEFTYVNGSTFDKFLIDQPILRRWYYRL